VSLPKALWTLHTVVKRYLRYCLFNGTVPARAITSTKVCSARADSISYTLSKANAVINILKALGINYNSSLVLIIRTILRFKVFRIKYLVCVAYIK
jgi:hypothetical protein